MSERGEGGTQFGRRNYSKKAERSRDLNLSRSFFILSGG
jgi:hypothetical protein